MPDRRRGSALPKPSKKPPKPPASPWTKRKPSNEWSGGRR